MSPILSPFQLDADGNLLHADSRVTIEFRPLTPNHTMIPDLLLRRIRAIAQKPGCSDDYVHGQISRVLRELGYVQLDPRESLSTSLNNLPPFIGHYVDDLRREVTVPVRGAIFERHEGKRATNVWERRAEEGMARLLARDFPTVDWEGAQERLTAVMGYEVSPGAAQRVHARAQELIREAKADLIDLEKGLSETTDDGEPAPAEPEQVVYMSRGGILYRVEGHRVELQEATTGCWTPSTLPPEALTNPERFIKLTLTGPDADVRTFGEGPSLRVDMVNHERSDSAEGTEGQIVYVKLDGYLVQGVFRFNGLRVERLAIDEDGVAFSWVAYYVEHAPESLKRAPFVRGVLQGDLIRLDDGRTVRIEGLSPRIKLVPLNLSDRDLGEKADLYEALRLLARALGATVMGSRQASDEAPDDDEPQDEEVVPPQSARDRLFETLDRVLRDLADTWNCAVCLRLRPSCYGLPEFLQLSRAHAQFPEDDVLMTRYPRSETSRG